MENNIGGQPPSSGRGRLQEVVVYRGSNSKALAGLNVWCYRWPLMWGGRFRVVVKHGGASCIIKPVFI